MRVRPYVAAGALALGLSAVPLTTLAFTHASSTHVAAVAIGHRGDAADAPENTMAAVDRAHRAGVDWVENDVQRTRDGQLVVMHDATLDRTTDARARYPHRAPWRIADFTLAEIERLDAGSWFGGGFTGQRVPTLDGYLRRIERNHQSLLLEIKNPRLYPGITRQIAGRLRAVGWLDAVHVRDRLMVQSFDADALRDFHRLCPGVTTGLLGNPPVRGIHRYTGYVDTINPDASRLTKGYIAAVRAVGGDHGKRLRVYPWVVDDGEQARALARLGASGIITNRPEALRAALAGGAAARPAGGHRPPAH